MAAGFKDDCKPSPAVKFEVALSSASSGLPLTGASSSSSTSPTQSLPNARTTTARYWQEGKTRLMTCPWCRETLSYNTKSDLYYHYVRHLKDELCRLNKSETHCDYCNVEILPKDIARHVGVKHKKIEEFVPDWAKFRKISKGNGHVANGFKSYKLNDEVSANTAAKQSCLPDETATNTAEQNAAHDITARQIDSLVNTSGHDDSIVESLPKPSSSVNDSAQENGNLRYIHLCSLCTSTANSGKEWKFKRHYVTHFHLQFLERNGSSEVCSLCKKRFNKACMLSRHLGINHKWVDTCTKETAEQTKGTKGVKISAGVENTTGVKYEEDDICDSEAKVVKEDSLDTDNVTASTKKEDFIGESAKSAQDEESSDRTDKIKESANEKHTAIELGEDTVKKTNMNGTQSENCMANSAGKIVTCYFCGKDVKNLNRSDLYKHYISHMREELFEINTSSSECTLCQKEFVKPSDLAKHVGLTHGKIDILIPDHAKVPPTLSSRKEKQKSITRRRKSNLAESSRSCTTTVPSSVPLAPLNCRRASSFSVVEAVTLKTPRPTFPAKAAKLKPDQLTREKTFAKFLSCFLCKEKILNNLSKFTRHYVKHFGKELLEDNNGDTSVCTLCGMTQIKGEMQRHLAYNHSLVNKYVPYHARFKRNNPEPHVIRRKHCFQCSQELVYKTMPELYSHYVQHYRKELECLNSKGEVGKCCICKVSLALGEVAEHLGIQHEQVENFIPEQARFGREEFRPASQSQLSTKSLSASSSSSQSITTASEESAVTTSSQYVNASTSHASIYIVEPSSPNQSNPSQGIINGRETTPESTALREFLELVEDKADQRGQRSPASVVSLGSIVLEKVKPRRRRSSCQEEWIVNKKLKRKHKDFPIEDDEDIDESPKDRCVQGRPSNGYDTTEEDTNDHNCSIGAPTTPCNHTVETEDITLTYIGSIEYKSEMAEVGKEGHGSEENICVHQREASPSSSRRPLAQSSPAKLRPGSPLAQSSQADFRPGSPIRRPQASPWNSRPGSPTGRPLAQSSPANSRPGSPIRRPMAQSSAANSRPGSPLRRPLAESSPANSRPESPIDPTIAGSRRDSQVCKIDTPISAGPSSFASDPISLPQPEPLQDILISSSQPSSSTSLLLPPMATSPPLRSPQPASSPLPPSLPSAPPPPLPLPASSPEPDNELNTSCELIEDLSETSFNTSNSEPVDEFFHPSSVINPAVKLTAYKSKQRGRILQKKSSLSPKDKQKKMRKRKQTGKTCQETNLVLSGRQKSFVKIRIKKTNVPTDTNCSNVSQPKRTSRKKNKLVKSSGQLKLKLKRSNSEMDRPTAASVKAGKSEEFLYCHICKNKFASGFRPVANAANNGGIMLLWLCSSCHAARDSVCVCSAAYSVVDQFQECRRCENLFHAKCLERTSFSKKILCGQCQA